MSSSFNDTYKVDYKNYFHLVPQQINVTNGIIRIIGHSFVDDIFLNQVFVLHYFRDPNYVVKNNNQIWQKKEQINLFSFPLSCVFGYMKKNNIIDSNSSSIEENNTSSIVIITTKAGTQSHIHPDDNMVVIDLELRKDQYTLAVLNGLFDLLIEKY